MNSTLNIADKLKALAGRGIAVSVSPSGALQVRPASRLTANDCEWLRDHTSAILAHLGNAVANTTTLTGNEPWDTQVAIKLMHDADTLVAQLGVSGRHPAVADAAAMVTSAFPTRDLETLRFAVSEFVVLVHNLAVRRTSAPETKR